jgi:DNA-binding protein YbaB
MHQNLSPGQDFQQFFDKQIKDMQAKAAALTEAFEDSSATVRSRDGAVTVTVAPNGALRDLQLGHRACELGPARLTAGIMEAVRAAQRQTANSVADSFAEITGEGDTTGLIRTFLPPQDEPDPALDQNGFFEEPEPEPEPTPSAARPSAITPPPARRRRPVADDDDFEETRLW